MDAVAVTVAELVLAQERLPPLVNVVHPHAGTWHDVFANIGDGLRDAGARHLALVPLAQWLQSLEGSASGDAAKDVERIVSNRYH